MSRCPPCPAQLTRLRWRCSGHTYSKLLLEDGLKVPRLTSCPLCPTKHCNFSLLQVTSETNLYWDCKLFLPLLNTSIGGCHINKRIRTFVLFSLYNNYLLPPFSAPNLTVNMRQLLRWTQRQRVRIIHRQKLSSSPRLDTSPHLAQPPHPHGENWQDFSPAPILQNSNKL